MSFLDDVCDYLDETITQSEKSARDFIFNDMNESLKKHWDYLEKIFKLVMAIDFSVLANVDASEVSYQKQLLYHKALQEII